MSAHAKAKARPRLPVLGDRETFLAMLYNGPLLYADALVILSGDGHTRTDAAVQTLRQSSGQAANWIVASGGLDNPPHAFTAAETRKYLIENGLHPDRIISEGASLNTRDQAVALAKLCAKHEWNRVLVVTSPYHMPRAFLTLLRALDERDITEKVQLVPLPASQTKWTDTPPGEQHKRVDLFAIELAKIDEYSRLGHVASYSEGLDYLRWWEGER